MYQSRFSLFPTEDELPRVLGVGVLYIDNNIAEGLASLLVFNRQTPQKPIYSWEEEILSFIVLHKNIEYQIQRKYYKS